MKCPKCGTNNKKDNDKCKSCNTLLHEDIKQIETTEVVSADVKVEELSETKNDGFSETTIEVKKVIPKKKKKSIFRRIWFLIKLIIVLSVLGIIALFGYAFFGYDYESYFKDNMNRYYETENEQYIENIKLMFRVYQYDDKKISIVQKNGYDIAQGWIDNVKNAEYVLEEEYIANLNNLKDVIDTLYNETESNGHTAISKKGYSSLSYELVELMEELETSKNESNNDSDTNNKEEIKKEEEVTQTNNYDVSKFKELKIDGVLKLFDDSSLSIVYMGRPTCYYCVQFVPVLQKVQDSLGYTTIYLDTTSLDRNDSKVSALIEKMNVNVMMNGKEELLKNYYGYTPMVLIIKDGKIVDANVGYIDYQELYKLISAYK